MPPDAATSELMRRFRSRDTKPEVELRRRLHAAGFRYRVHVRVPDFPRRTIDIAFPGLKLAIFVDGCYWHACPLHGKVPSRNEGWWSEKLRRNTERDHETNRALRDGGWTVVRVWEHEDPADVAVRVALIVDQLRQ